MIDSFLGNVAKNALKRSDMDITTEKVEPANTAMLALWQLLDSAFPSGGFAHSAGLESAMHHGFVDVEAQFESFVVTSLANTRRAMLPMLLHAHREPERWMQWDQTCEAMLTNHVARRASQSQGHAFLIAIEQTTGHPALQRMRAAVRRQESPGHWPICFGAATALLDFDEASVTGVFCFMLVRGIVGSAVRLGMVGPMRGQSLQWNLRLAVKQTIDRALTEPASMPTAVAPIADILQASHDRLYSRLFQT